MPYLVTPRSLKEKVNNNYNEVTNYVFCKVIVSSEILHLEI